MRIHAVILAVALTAAPLVAKGADLVVWWEQGFYPQEDEAVAEIIATFEQETGKQVELVHYSNEELPQKLVAALEAGRPPDFAFGLWLSEYSAKWAFEDRLVDLSDVVGWTRSHHVIDDPAVRRKLVQAIDSYTAIYRSGCTPPESASWSGLGHNEAFLAQTVVLTANLTLSIPNALKRGRPDDYYEKVATIEWPLGPGGEAFAIVGDLFPAVVFKDGANAAAAEERVRFLVAEGWLIHYLNFSGERFLPPISKLLDEPFWLDPSDPHRMAAVMQVSSRPLLHKHGTATGN